MTIRTSEQITSSLGLCRSTRRTTGRWCVIAMTATALIVGCANSTLESQAGMAKASPPIESKSENTMDRLKRDVDRLLSTPFDDVQALNVHLQAQLGPVQPHGQTDVRKAQGGTLAGIALKDIELRSAQDDPGHATLLLDLGSSELALQDPPWPAAVLYPPRPDAPDSNAYWSIQMGGASVIIGLAPDQTHVRYISIGKR